MFSDTHCHVHHMRTRGILIEELFHEMDTRGYRFVMDIGTKPGDLASRLAVLREAWHEACHGGSQEGSREMGTPTGTDALPPWLFASCGIWPDSGAIAARDESLARLKSDLADLEALGLPYAALGECGLDRYWNGEAGAGRAVGEDGPGTLDIAGEEELFASQLELALDRSLAVIVHSRDAFDQTRSIIASSGVSRGVIHCFSYGVGEARAFLDLGWHISFPGTITWGKREADRERAESLLRYVPRERLLLETDAPYLAPVPHRGSVNTPLLIEETYKAAAAFLGLEPAALALLVEDNAKRLFAVR